MGAGLPTSLLTPTVPLIGLLLISAIFAWGFRTVLVEWVRVQRILGTSMGIRGKYGILRIAGRVAGILVVAAAGSAVFLLPRVIPSLPLWACLAFVYGALILWRLIDRRSILHSVAEVLFFLGMFLGSALSAFPAASRWIVFTVAALLMLTALIVRSRPEVGYGWVSWSALNAYNQGDYPLAIKEARKKDQLQYHRGTVAVLSEYRMGEFEAAEALVRRSLELQTIGRLAAPRAALLARIQMEKGEYAAATQTLDGAAALDPKNPTVPRVRTLLALRHGVAPPPINPPTNGKETPIEAAIRAWTLAENGMFDQAREIIDFAAVEPQSLPDLAETCYYAGRALAKCADVMKAEEFFHVAIRAEGNALFGALARRQFSVSRTDSI